MYVTVCTNVFFNTSAPMCVHDKIHAQTYVTHKPDYM